MNYFFELKIWIGLSIRKKSKIKINLGISTNSIIQKTNLHFSANSPKEKLKDIPKT